MCGSCVVRNREGELLEEGGNLMDGRRTESENMRKRTVEVRVPFTEIPAKVAPGGESKK